MDLQLFEHNKKAYEAARRLMEETGKAAVVHPTGTGKSLLAFQLALDCPKKTVVWLSPSACIFRTQLENVKEMLRNAGKQAESGRCRLESGKDGVDIPRLPYGTEAEEESGSLFQNIRFLTYAKLMHNENQIESLNAEYIVLDEFHRCGAQEWGKSVKRLLSAYPNAQVLGLSATHVRYLDGQRDMAQELFEGNIASEMSLGEAVGRGILPVPTYVVSVYSWQEELEKWHKRVETIKSAAQKEETQQLLQQLRRALEQAQGLDRMFARHMKKNGKYLVFCSGKEHMAQMKQQAAEWFSRVDEKPHLYEVTYENPSADSIWKAFQADDSMHVKALFCIDMLNEGVHVDGVDGVILLRPTVSPILYLQQIGRCLSAGKKTTPVIFDIVNNFDALCTIDALKGEMEEAYVFFSRREQTGMPFSEYFYIYEEVKDCRRLFARLKSILLADWERYYQEAEAYHKMFGHLNIQKNYVTESGLALGAWLMTQRRIRFGKVAGNLTEERIERLDRIGMDWACGSDRSFQRGYAALKVYKKEHGNVDVKADYVTEEGYALGKCVSNLRSRFKRGEYENAGVPLSEEKGKKRITREQMQLLNELGMIWDKNAYQWNRNFVEAKRYYEENRNLDIPKEFLTVDGIHLRTWLKNQQKIHAGKKKGAAPLTNGQIQQLESIGIVKEFPKNFHYQSFL